MYNIYSQSISFVRYVKGNSVTEDLENKMTSNDLIVLELDLNESFFSERICRISLPVHYSNGRKGFRLSAVVIDCSDLTNASAIRSALNIAKQNIKNIVDEVKVEPYVPKSDYLLYTQILDLTNIEFRENFSTKKVILVIENNYGNYEDDEDKKFKLYIENVYLERRYLNSSRELVNIGNNRFGVNLLSGSFTYSNSFNEIISENIKVPLTFMLNSKDTDFNYMPLESYIINNFQYYTLFGASNLKPENSYDNDVLTFFTPQGIIKYYYIIEYDEQLYRKLNIKCSCRCAFNRSDKSYIYFVENNNLPTDSYILVDNNENKLFFREQGVGSLVVTKIEDKYNNSIDFIYNPDVNEENFITNYAHIERANNGKVIFEYIKKSNDLFDEGLNKVTFIESDNEKRYLNIFYSYYDFNPREYVEKVTIEYTYENLETSEYVLLEKEELTYNENGALIKIEKYHEDFLLEKIEIDYFDEKVSIVSGYINSSSDDNSLTRIIDYKFNYQKDYTTVTDDINNISNTYYFDEYLNVREIISSDTSRKSNFYELDLLTRSYFQPTLLKDNLKNGSFENNLEMWNYSGNIGSIETGIVSNKCLRVDAGKTLNQSVVLEAGERYQINGFVKHATKETTIHSTLALEISYKIPLEQNDDVTITPPEPNSRQVFINETVELDNTKNNWYEVTSNEIVIPNNAFDINAIFHISTVEEVYFDNLKITYENENNYSLIDERFEVDNLSTIVATNDSTKFKVASLSDVELVEVESTLDHPSSLGPKALKIKGFNYNGENHKTISKYYSISGKRNEKYSVGVFLKGKTKASDISKLEVVLQYSTKQKTFTFNASPYLGYFQKVFGTFIPEENFSGLHIKYVYGGHNDIILDGFELLKDTSSVNNTFDQNGIPMSLGNDVLTSLNFYKNGELKRQITSNSYTLFEYNDNNDLIEKRGLFEGVSIYGYSPDRRLTSETITLGQEIFTKSYSYTNNHVTKLTDTFNNDILMDYDYRHRITNKSMVNMINEDTFYTINNNLSYNFKDQVERLSVNIPSDNLTNQNDLEYDGLGNLVKITSDTNSKPVYDFIYSQNGLLEKIYHDTKEIENNTYGTYGNLVKQNLKYGEYEYEYDWKNRLKRIYQKNSENNQLELLLEYTYNKSNNVIKIEDVKNNKKLFYSYDGLGRLKTLFDSNFNRVEYLYDIYGNLSQKNYHYDEYINQITYSYPMKEQTKEGYISKLITKYGADVVFGEDLTKGLMGLVGQASNISLVYDPTFKAQVTNLDKMGSLLSYDLLSANTDYENNVYLGELYTPVLFEEKLSNNKHFGIWIKISSVFYESNLFTLKDINNQKKAELKILSGGKIGLYVSEQEILKTTSNLSLNTWNYVSLNMFYNKKGQTSQSIICTVKLNSETQIKSTLTDIINNTTKLVVGEYEVSQEDMSLDVNLDNTLRPMPIKIGLLTVDAFPHITQTLNEVHDEGEKYFVDDLKEMYSVTSTKQNNVPHQYKDTSDLLGRLTKKEFIVNNTTKFYNLYEYDKTRVIHQTNKNNDTIQYDYDSIGNIISKTINNITTNYTYDGLNRLMSEEKGNEKVEYTYDHNGNISTIKKLLNNLIIETQNYTYDNTIKDLLLNIRINNQNYCEIEYTNDFYPSKINDVNYTWEQGRLCQVGDNLYEYDNFGLRTKKILPDKEISYFYEGSLLVKEDIKINDITTSLKYIYDSNNQLVGLIESNNVYYYEKDITGNIIGIVDTNGNYIVKYTYNAWGKLLNKQVIVDSTASQYNPFIYKGYYYDVETEFYYCNSRYYSPELCRWISPDSIEYLDPESINGLNLYCYCMNSPIMYSDPSGHFTIAALLVSIGISLAFEVLEDLIGDGKLGGDKDGWDYLGAGIAGFFGGLGGGLAVQTIFSVAGGLADAVISGDFAENGFWSTMGSITLSTVISFGAGALSRRITNNVQIKKLNADLFNNRNVVRNLGINYSFKKNGKSVQAAAKAIRNGNWISKTLWEVFSSNLGGSATSFVWGLTF